MIRPLPGNCQKERQQQQQKLLQNAFAFCFVLFVAIFHLQCLMENQAISFSAGPGCAYVFPSLAPPASPPPPP